MRHAAATLLLILFSFVSIVFGGSAFAATGFATLGSNCIGYGPATYQSSASVNISGYGDWYTYRDFYKPDLQPEVTCSITYGIYVTNSPGGPATGNTSTSTNTSQTNLRLEQLKLRMLEKIKLRTPLYNKSHPIYKKPSTSAGGVRASLDGFDLTEASPDGEMILVDIIGTDDLYLPFMVNNAGDGDWLSISIRGTEFFRQPLASFSLDELYFAILPGSLFGSGGGPDALVYFLESAGNANASVFVGLGPTVVPIPPAVLLFGSALGLMGWMRRKAGSYSALSHAVSLT